jgi:hypothetical protein
MHAHACQQEAWWSENGRGTLNAGSENAWHPERRHPERRIEQQLVHSGEHLDRHVTFQLGVAGAIDLAHAAFAELGGDLAAADTGADHRASDRRCDPRSRWVDATRVRRS